MRSFLHKNQCEILCIGAGWLAGWRYMVLALREHHLCDDERDRWYETSNSLGFGWFVWSRITYLQSRWRMTHFCVCVDWQEEFPNMILFHSLIIPWCTVPESDAIDEFHNLCIIWILNVPLFNNALAYNSSEFFEFVLCILISPIANHITFNIGWKWW